MFGKNKKKKGILGLEGQAYLDAYNQKMNDTGKTISLEAFGVRVTSISVLKLQPSACTDLFISTKVDWAIFTSTGSEPVSVFTGASPIAANIMLIASSSVVAATAMI